MTKIKDGHIPRASMCMVCEYFFDDCSDLPFPAMKPMAQQDEDGLTVVKCIKFKRENWNKEKTEHV